MKKFVLKMRALLSLVLFLGISTIHADSHGEYQDFTTFIKYIISQIGSQISINESPKPVQQVCYRELARNARMQNNRSTVQPVAYDKPVAARATTFIQATPAYAPKAQVPGIIAQEASYTQQMATITPAPIAKTAITQQAKVVVNEAKTQNELKAILEHLEQYVHNIYGCVVNFFDKNNTQKCAAHADAFGSHLHILQEKVLAPLKKLGNNPLAHKIAEIAVELERSQHKMYNILKAGYNSTQLMAKLAALNSEISAKNKQLVKHTIPAIEEYMRQVAPDLNGVLSNIKRKAIELTEYNPGNMQALRAIMKRA